MAVFGLFSRRDKQRPSGDTKHDGKATTPDASASDAHSLSEAASSSSKPSPSSSHSVYGGPSGASSSKLMLGFAGKKGKPSHRTDDSGHLRAPATDSTKPRFSTSKSESGHDYLRPPPSRSGLFASYAGTDGALSTRSLPTSTASQPASSRLAPDPSSRSTSTPKPKGMFSWAHRERKKSKALPLDPSPVSPDDSFNLKSFRHVRPVSPSPTDISPPSPLSVAGMMPPTRPRGNSVASADSSQRISVAAFREMAARRSAANSPSPSSTDVRADASSFLRASSTFSQGAGSSPPPALRRPKATSSSVVDSTSSESESEDDDDSAGSSTVRPKRPGKTGTVSPRSAGKNTSELGHLTRPAPTPQQMTLSASAHGDAAERTSLYSRARASQSTSALMPNAAAQRASMLVAANKGPVCKTPSKANGSDTDESSSDSDDSDSDNVPLVNKVMGHRRTGSRTSVATAGTNVSRARIPPKPLIDIAGLSPPILSEREKLPVTPMEEPKEKTKEGNKENVEAREAPEVPKELDEKASASHASKPTLNDRLARLAASVSPGRSSTALVGTADEVEKGNTERGHSPGPPLQPKRSQTLPVDPTLEPMPSSPSTSPAVSGFAPKPKSNGRSLSTPVAFDSIKDLSDPNPIVPTLIRERSPPPAFSVTSRPASQMSLASHIQFGASRPEQSPSSQSTSPLTTAQARLMAARTPSPSVVASPSEPRTPVELRSPVESHSRTQSRPPETRSSSSPTVRQQPLVPDNGMHSPKGFTGAGLLGNATAAEVGRASSASSNSTAPSRARRRSQTMEHLTNLQPVKESTAAPTPLRPQRLIDPRVVSTSSESSQTSASTSGSASSPKASIPPVASSFQQRARARTMELPANSAVNLNVQGLGSIPPVKPFATGVRGYSPASSTGESSSGRTPVTPLDGSELSFTTREQGRGPGESSSAARRAQHRKRTSVTFAELEGQRGRTGVTEREREVDKAKGEVTTESAITAESRRKQRRRSEAIAALEFGKIVNGRSTADEDDDEDLPLDNVPPRMSMMSNMMVPPVTGSMNMNMPSSSPMTWTNPPTGMMTPNQFMFPSVPSGTDPSFLTAHRQAMMIAKQAYQIAVAQQAMAAAEEEWERGSTAATSILNGGMGGRTSNFGVGSTPMSPMYGMGMPGMGMGMNMAWPGMMGGFPPSAQSMYAGSVVGSDLGTGTRAQGWGSRSAYGDPSAADRSTMFRGSTFGTQPPMPPRTASSNNVQPMAQRPAPRQRTRTSPSVPVSSEAKRGPVPPLPPSSWKSGSRPT